MKQINDNLFLFNYGLFNTNCFIIKTASRLFIVDTYMGPESIADMKSFAGQMAEGRQCFVINTHHHYDHIWGNCLFDPKSIIAHENCLEQMKMSALETLEGYRQTNPQWIAGDVRIVLPSITFSERLSFADDDCTVILEHLPGHSSDSILIWLEPYHICIAGDSLEDPLPLVHEDSELAGADVLLKNLKLLAQKAPVSVFPSHGNRTDPALIADNIFYLESLLKKSPQREADKLAAADFLSNGTVVADEFYIDSHRENLLKTRRRIELNGQ